MTTEHDVQRITVNATVKKYGYEVPYFGGRRRYFVEVEHDDGDVFMFWQGAGLEGRDQWYMKLLKGDRVCVEYRYYTTGSGDGWRHFLEPAPERRNVKWGAA